MLSQGHMFAASYCYTSKVGPRFGMSGPFEEWKWRHNITIEADIHLRPLHTSILDIYIKCFKHWYAVSRAYGCTLMLEEFVFHTHPYSKASVDQACGQGRRISLASNNPFILALVLSIHHLWNYGVKMRKSHRIGKDPLPVASTKRYFKPRSVRLPYGTICTCVRVRIHAYKYASSNPACI